MYHNFYVRLALWQCKFVIFYTDVKYSSYFLVIVFISILIMHIIDVMFIILVSFAYLLLI